jgi:O-acetyl-ADP-ribose deacetylase (regulator of RNase III)
VRIEVVRGDLTDQDVDAIVNAANRSLLGGGGVDGAIHAAAGPGLLAECTELRRTTLPDGLPTGDCIATGAGRLPCRNVLHTVGPIHHQHRDGGSELLRSCHRRCLEEAEKLGVRSVAFPAISCGAYGWDPVDAAPIAVRAVREHPSVSVELVRFVLANDRAYEAFAAAADAD